MDIKPKNIAYSPSFQKPVFIDFDVSRFVSERINEKSFTVFTGSYTFMSEDMKRMFKDRSERFVNLYWNDLCMLRNTFLGMNDDRLQERM